MSEIDNGSSHAIKAEAAKRAITNDLAGDTEFLSLILQRGTEKSANRCGCKRADRNKQVEECNGSLNPQAATSWMNVKQAGAIDKTRREARRFHHDRPLSFHRRRTTDIMGKHEAA